MTFRYVPHYKVLDYMFCGWMIAEDMANPSGHNLYSVLMKYCCECKEVKPL